MFGVGLEVFCSLGNSDLCPQQLSPAPLLQVVLLAASPPLHLRFCLLSLTLGSQDDSRRSTSDFSLLLKVPHLLCFRRALALAVACGHWDPLVSEVLHADVLY